MTTKHKIALGFFCTIVIMFALAFFGYRSLSGSLNGLVEYRKFARINVLLSDSMNNLTGAGSNAMFFLSVRDPKIMEGALHSLDAMDSLLVDAEKEMSIQTNLEMVASIRSKGREYRAGLGRDLEILTKAKTIYESQVLPNALDFEKTMLSLSELAQKENNIALLGTLDHIWSYYSRMMAALSHLDTTRSLADFAIADENAQAIKPCLDQAREAMFTASEQSLHDELMNTVSVIFNSANEMGKTAQASADNVVSNRAVRTALTKDLSTFSREFDEQMRNLGVNTTRAIENGQSTLLAVSASGVLIALALAAFITLSLLRTLNTLAGYAGAVARGDFTHTIQSREKGEVGSVISSMQQITVLLEHLLDEMRTLAETILSGKLRNRLDPSTFPGSFSELTHSVNAIGDAFTSLVDDLGVPIMCCDKQRHIAFLNKLAQSAVGGNLVGKPCAEILKADSCSKNCFGNSAMKQKAMVSGETTIHPGGKSLLVNVTAIPLCNQKEEVVGFAELLTDLTEIRSKQALMLQVAGEASEISNRIAAASEELSAQVEQISRGAEVQRDRVNSTASAMSEMNSTVIEVARNVGEASEQSEVTRQKALYGAELVEQVVTAIHGVDTVAQRLHSNMQEFSKQAESIGTVMNVISDIADQTNLLALNAAIEAARAGEAGRGFAVVADEVRKLAEKTMQATQEVSASISAIQHSAHSNIAEVDKAVASVSEANKLAFSSGEALKEIVDMASSSSSVVASIATAAEEQSATSEEISLSTEEINRIVSETTEGMVQSSAAVQELSLMAQELRRVMEELK